MDDLTAPPEEAPTSGDTQSLLRPRSGRIAAIAALLVAVLAVGAAAAWWLLSAPERAAYSHPAAKAVDTVFKVRSRMSTDPADYEPYVESGLATELALDSAAKAREGISPLPRWKPPYVSAETSSGADVIVVWKRSVEHTSWPEAHRFKMVLSGDLWKMGDAEALEASRVPEPMRGD